MSATSVFNMGFLSIIAATGLLVASYGFAADAHQRVDVIGTIHETVVQLDSGLKSTEANSKRVDVIGTIDGKEGNGSQEPAYPYSMPMSR
jgi:hypothetical protein